MVRVQAVRSTKDMKEGIMNVLADLTLYIPYKAAHTMAPYLQAYLKG